MKKKHNTAELQWYEHVKQYLIECKQCNISLEQLINEVDSAREMLQFMVK